MPAYHVRSEAVDISHYLVPTTTEKASHFPHHIIITTRPVLSPLRLCQLLSLSFAAQSQSTLFRIITTTLFSHPIECNPLTLPTSPLLQTNPPPLLY